MALAAVDGEVQDNRGMDVLQISAGRIRRDLKFLDLHIDMVNRRRQRVVEVEARWVACGIYGTKSGEHYSFSWGSRGKAAPGNEEYDHAREKEQGFHGAPFVCLRRPVMESYRRVHLR